MVHTEHSIMNDVCRAYYSVQCTQNIVKCMVHTEHSTVYGVQNQRWNNVQACKQHLCKFSPSLGKICAKFYAVLFVAQVSYIAFCASWGNTYGFLFGTF